MQVIVIPLFVLGFLGLSSCHALKRPYQASWSQPLDLGLQGGVLPDTTVRLLCTQDDKLDSEFPSHSCERIALYLENLGIQILGPYTSEKAPKPDSKKANFTVQFVEREDESLGGGWTYFLCWPTLTLFPCINSYRTHAELILFDQKHRTRVPTSLDVVKMYGIGALAMKGLVSMNSPLKQLEAQIGPNLLQTILNHTYTFATKQQISKGRFSL